MNEWINEEGNNEDYKLQPTMRVSHSQLANENVINHMAFHFLSPSHSLTKISFPKQ